MLDPMDMTMDVYEVNDLKEWWDTDLEVSEIFSLSAAKINYPLALIKIRLKEKKHVGIKALSSPPIPRPLTFYAL